MSHRKDSYLVSKHSLPEIKEKMADLTSIYGMKRPTTSKPRPHTGRSKSARRPKTSTTRVPTLPDENRICSIEDPIQPIEYAIPLVEDPIQPDEYPISLNEDPIQPDEYPISLVEDPVRYAPVEFILPDISTIKQVILNMCVGETSTQLKMTPKWFEQEDQQEALRNIVYPPGVIDKRPFDSVARYRAAFKKTNDFKKKAIESSTNSTETLIISLDKFAQQFSGDLSFTNKKVSFSESAYRTACGIATLGSAHLLATNHIPTARFVFHTKLNYKTDLAKSDDTMRNFVLSFASAIADVVKCENDYVRVFSVEKNDDDEGNAKVDFGITTPEQVTTEFLANDLADYARSGFHDNRVLKHIISRKYSYSWTTFLTYLQLRPQDFVKEHNYGYTKADLRENCGRGGYVYNIPVGWYRHSLDILTKYPGNNLWLGCKNIEGEWPIAFHGTHAESVSNITKDGLSIDRVERDDMRKEAVQQMGSKFDSPGLYLATHCKGGAHPQYTKTFSVFISEKKTERFRVVFQCRVKPGEFTVHKSPSKTGETWRIVDPTAVRPYGILVRKRKAPKKEGDESESDGEPFKG